jgi:hypothetical protein
MEKAGCATRTPGGREGARRLPDSWRATVTSEDRAATTTEGDAVEASDPDLSYELWDTRSGNRLGEFASEADALEGVRETAAINGPRLVENLVLDAHDRSGNHHPVAQGRELAERARVGTGASGLEDVRQAERDDSERPAPEGEPEAPQPAGGPVGPEPEEAGAKAAAATAREPDQSTDGGGVRLRPGALRDMVLGYLRERPDQALSPSAIGKALGRSSGAVANCCEKLEADRAVVQTSQKPRRYRLL